MLQTLSVKELDKVGGGEIPWSPLGLALAGVALGGLAITVTGIMSCCGQDAAEQLEDYLAGNGGHWHSCYTGRIFLSGFCCSFFGPLSGLAILAAGASLSASFGLTVYGYDQQKRKKSINA